MVVTGYRRRIEKRLKVSAAAGYHIDLQLWIRLGDWRFREA
jgi:hypothetical protein